MTRAVSRAQDQARAGGSLLEPGGARGPIAALVGGEDANAEDANLDIVGKIVI